MGPYDAFEAKQESIRLQHMAVLRLLRLRVFEQDVRGKSTQRR